MLRTNASATGATALRALLGTVIGSVIGGALFIAIGTSTVALWIVLPVAVLIAAYAPRYRALRCRASSLHGNGRCPVQLAGACRMEGR